MAPPAQTRRIRPWWVAVVAVAVMAAACGSSEPVVSDAGPDDSAEIATKGQDDADATAEPQELTTPPTPTPAPAPTLEPSAPAPTPTEPAPSPTVVERAAAPNSRTAPAVATDPVGLASQIQQADTVLRRADASPVAHADAGHLHQVAIRKIGYEPDWDIAFFEALPAELRDGTRLHVSARRALIDLHSGYDAADFIPAWRIIEPEPKEALLGYYRDAEAATSVEWEYLAAINLIETGMGRIQGLSSAGAQGPMQFLPTTWAEAGIGDGDINDPEDAIHAAARYLVRRGGPSDMAAAIWGYNNSDNYVSAVQAYAEMLRRDPAAFDAIYHWEIYFFTEQGDVWLPAGFETAESIDLDDFLTANPWSEPDAGLR